MGKLILETLSPIHIGSGEKYSSSEFFLDDYRIFRIDINKIYSNLNQKDKDIFLNYLENPNFRLEDFLKKKIFRFLN
jgi:CRISPR type III-A-associated RAMP protein Csm5